MTREARDSHKKAQDNEAGYSMDMGADAADEMMAWGNKGQRGCGGARKMSFMTL
jgi:hypothetical protein